MASQAIAALAICLGASVWGVVTSVRIQEFLPRRGRKVNPLWLRWRIFTYIVEYRRITRRELGHPGILSMHFATAWLVALAAAIFEVVILRSS
jgi:hypothetical protein